MEEQIKFDESQYAYAMNQKTPSGIPGLVVRLGLAKDEEGAQKVLLVIFVVCVVATIAIFYSTTEAPSLVPAP